MAPRIGDHGVGHADRPTPGVPEVDRHHPVVCAARYGLPVGALGLFLGWQVQLRIDQGVRKFGPCPPRGFSAFESELVSDFFGELDLPQLGGSVFDQIVRRGFSRAFLGRRSFSIRWWALIQTLPCPLMRPLSWRVRLSRHASAALRVRRVEFPKSRQLSGPEAGDRRPIDPGDRARATCRPWIAGAEWRAARGPSSPRNPISCRRSSGPRARSSL